jgi:PPM family protein phosphatase
VEIEIVALSQQGGRNYNEDSQGHWHDDQYIICVVADGAGGHGGGDVASAIVRTSVLSGFSAQPQLSGAALRDLLLQANAEVLARQKEGGKLSAMRTTAVVAVIDLYANQLIWAHCGDSRAYLFRSRALQTRTIDHSLVQQMVSTGMIDDEGARMHTQRNLLLSALGATEDEIEITVSEPMDIEPGDVLLLCSDGIWEPLGDTTIERLLLRAASPKSWLQQMDESVKANAKPDHDNYTALTLWAYAADEVTQIAPLQ